MFLGLYVSGEDEVARWRWRWRGLALEGQGGIWNRFVGEETGGSKGRGGGMEIGLNWRVGKCKGGGAGSTESRLQYARVAATLCRSVVQYVLNAASRRKLQMDS